MVFAIHWHDQPWIYMFSPSRSPLPHPWPSHPSGSSQCTKPDNPICKTEKETQMYRPDSWTLWEKARVGCSERTALKQVYYQGWNRSPAQVGCMILILYPCFHISSSSFSSVQSLSCVQLFVNPWTAAHQASLSIANLWSLLQLMFIESGMPSNHLIFCHLHLLPHSIFSSIRVFSKESVLLIRWPKYWSFSFSISPSNEYSDLFPLGWTACISLKSRRLWTVSSDTTVQKHQFFGTQFSL